MTQLSHDLKLKRCKLQKVKRKNTPTTEPWHSSSSITTSKQHELFHGTSWYQNEINNCVIKATLVSHHRNTMQCDKFLWWWKIREDMRKSDHLSVKWLAQGLEVMKKIKQGEKTWPRRTPKALCKPNSNTTRGLRLTSPKHLARGHQL